MANVQHFPQDVGVCDVCNAAVTDEKFNALEECWEFPGYLYCKKCFDHYKPDKSREVFPDGTVWECKRKFNVGDNLRDAGLCGGITFYG